jgi:hypothetical protein
MGEWIVRAGEARPDQLIKGYREHLGALGVYGFSVQYNPGSTVDALALAGAFSNGQISYQDEDVLQAAVAPLSYRLSIIQTPGSGYHHTCAVLYDATGTMLHALPPDAALALSNAFIRMTNPHRLPYRRP